MLQIENNHLNKCIKKIQNATIGIEKTLQKIFSDTSRSFSVHIDNKTYLIFNPTTLEEKLDQELVRKEVVLLLLKISFNALVDNLNNSTQINSWADDLVVFSVGNPKEYYQIEKISEESVSEIDKEKSLHTRGMLDIDNSYLIMENENLSSDQAVELLKKRINHENIE